MKALKKRIDLVFLVSGILIIVLGNIFSDDGAFDVQAHSSYVVIDHTFISLVLGLYFLFCAFLYFLFQYVFKGIAHQGGLIHYLGTVGSVMILLGMIIIPFGWKIHSPYNTLESLNRLITGSLIVFVLFQLLLPFNLLRSLYLRRKQKG